MERDVKILANQFREDGYLSPVSIYSDQEISKTKSSFLEFENNLDKVREDYENLHFHSTWARDLATHPKLLDLIETIIGPEILIYGSLILNKIPGNNSHLSWHQDQYFFPEKKSTPYISAWIALTHSTANNGCMKMLPFSHKEGILPHLPFSKDDTNLLTKGEEIKISPTNDQIFDNILSPGQLSLHDGALVHSSSPNLTDQNRIGFIVRFVTPDISITNNPLLQVRGNKTISHLPIYKKPSFSSVDKAIKSYQNKNIKNSTLEKS